MSDLNKHRPIREMRKGKLFEVEPAWKDDWWGMPEFEMQDATPGYRIVVNFMTADDIKDFAEKLGVRVTKKSNSMWWPDQKRLKNSEFEYVGKPTDSKYPICIPSKGRADCQTTGTLLKKMGVSHLFFVEETEYDNYCEHLGEERIVSMPFHDLKKGSIPARNFIWEWAKEREYKRHWTVDDNIVMLSRCNHNRRLRVRGGGFFRAMEDFVDRYENVAMAGPHEQGFVPDRTGRVTPFLLNSRIYSCILLDTNLPYRWRGRYNEDTDLSLRLLKDNYCTMLFRALLMDKMDTHSGGAEKKSTAMKGGNTDNVYNTDDYRMSFAKSLQRQHPDVVNVVWKFGRWHHQVDYSKFKHNKLIMRSDITPTVGNNEYGMLLKREDKAK